MKCRPCDECIVGNLYNLYDGKCSACGNIGNSRVGIYIGLKDIYHKFRIVKPVKCICGSVIDEDWIPCAYSEPDAEMEKFFGVNQAHLVGR